MQYTLENLVIYPLIPEMFIALMAMFILLLDVFLTDAKKKLVPALSILTLLTAMIISFCAVGDAPVSAFFNYVIQDSFAAFSKGLICAAGIFTIVMSQRYMKGESHLGEYYVLILFSILGMMLMVSANNFLSMYLGMELMALSVYVLVGYQRDMLRSSEAALKYFVLGSLASCMLLYGVTFLYGVSGSLHFSDVAKALSHHEAQTSMAVLTGLVFIMAGFAFKVSMAPFHMWTPDTYEGAPTPITAFMSVAPKVAGFVLFIRVLHDALAPMLNEYVTILSVLAVLSMIIGNLAAIAQRSIKRMLAYSTVGHVGFILLGVISATEEGYTAVLFYMLIYLFMTMGVFSVLLLMRRDGLKGELLDDFAGLIHVHKGYAIAMVLLMFSMAGIPFLGGFWAKFYVFMSAFNAGYTQLALIGLLFSAIGAFYYIRVIKYVLFDSEREAFNPLSDKPLQAVLVLCTLFVLVSGFFPDPLIKVCQAALVGFI
ncbi:MAG: NADH-quinone oxidoreductase subunit N [Mariprofundaceae bacterium]|nr:NADH-quinone oxidoreductase subunit N [Mariprofundaceae bacterium]